VGPPAGEELTSGLEVFFLLVMGHFVGDFALQSDRMAVEKCRGKDQTLAWQWWLTAHAGIHSFLVAVLSGVVWLGMLEWFLHALIDLGKCRHRFGLGVDQGLHILCKLVYVVMIVAL
jgi:hypothetical protein